MNLSEFARQRWEDGDRDTDELTDQFLTAALASTDPREALRQPVRDAMSHQVKRLRAALESQVPRWNRAAPIVQPLPSPASGGVLVQSADGSHGPCGQGTASQSESGGSQVQTPDGSQIYYGLAAAPVDARQLLLEQDVWIPEAGGSKIVKWRDLTLEDIEAAIRHYRREASGVRRKIQRLESARSLIIQHGVQRLGEIPPAALGFLEEPENPAA